MTQPTVHDSRAWHLLGEQIRVARRTLHDEGIVFAILLLLSPFVHKLLSENTAQSSPFIYTVPSTFLPMLGGLVVSLRLWQENEPRRRSYQAAVSVAPGTLTLITVAAGWIWLLIGVMSYNVWSIGVTAFGQWIGHHTVVGTHPPLWHWAIPFGAASLVYLFVSLATVGSNSPWQWLIRLSIAYGLALVIVSYNPNKAPSQFRIVANKFLWSISHGSQGAATALWGRQEIPYVVSYILVDTTFIVYNTGRIDTMWHRDFTQWRAGFIEGVNTENVGRNGGTNHCTPQDTTVRAFHHHHEPPSDMWAWPSSYVLSMWQWLRVLFVWLSIGIICVCLVSYYIGSAKTRDRTIVA